MKDVYIYGADEVKVYVGENNHVVVQQVNDECPDGYSYLVLLPEQTKKVIKAMQQAIKEIGNG